MKKSLIEWGYIMIETYLLEHLAAFKKYKTLSEAAEQVHVTQPTMTRSMTKLEDIFGVPLFTREKKRLRLNDNGELASKYAEDILDMQDKMLSQVRQLDRLSKTITVGSVAPGPIMELTPLLTSNFSKMTVSTELKSEEELLHGLKNDIYQMIILPQPFKEDGLHSQKCGSEQLCASLVPTHPLAEKSSVSFRDLNGENFLMASEVGMWDSIVRTNMPDSRFLLQGSTDELLEVASSSTMSGFSTDLTLRVLGGRNNRVNIPFSDDVSYTDYYCICKASKKSEYKRWFDTLKRRVNS